MNSDTRSILYVNVSVANVHSGCTFGSEVVTQALMGERVEELEKDSDWVRIRQWDGYEGWIHRFFLAEANGRYSEGFATGESYVVDDLFGRVHAEHSRSSPVIRDLVYGDELVRLDRRSEWTRVLLPDGKSGWTDSPRTPAVSGDVRRHVTGLARRFSGIQYLWGGKSPKGFDCSGFSQTVMKSVFPLPRDARDQAEDLHLVDTDLETVREGDLIFFSLEGEEVDHVAISLGEDSFIHCSGFVRIESFDGKSSVYNHRLRTHIHRVKSIERVCR
ncbi:MAG: C40 family peptidase [Fidelibacterota bacterium]